MLKLGKQILHTLVLLITGMALIGVNVTQSGFVFIRTAHISKSESCLQRTHVLAKRDVAVVRGNGNFAKIVVMLLPVMIFIK